MKPVTDPSLLAQLDGGANTPPAVNLKPVTDPSLLAALETPSKPEDDGFFSRVGRDYERNLDKMQDSADAYVRGEQSLPETVGQQALQYAQIAPQFVGQGFVSGFRALPDFIEQPIRKGASTAYTAVKNTPVPFTDGDVGDLAHSAVQEYSDFAKEHPRAARNINAAVNAGNIALALTPVKGQTAAGASTKAVGQSAKALKTGVNTARAGARNLATKGRGLFDSSAHIPRTGIEKPLQKILARSDKTPDQILSELRSGKISTIADVGGEEIRGITRAVGRQSGAKNVIADNLNNRSLSSVSRVSKDLGKVSRVDDYFSSLDDIVTQGRERAAPLYQRAFGANKSIVSREIDNILETPAGKKALKDSAKVMQNDRSLMGLPDKELKAIQRELSAIGKMDEVSGPIAGGLSMRTLDTVKKNLDDQISQLYRAGANYEASVLVNLKNNLKKEMIKADKTGAYKRALEKSGDYLSLSSAMENGKNFTNLRPEQIRKSMIAMSPAERKAYRAGARESLQKIIYKTSDGADPAKRIFGNTEKREQLKALFPDQKSFSKFERRMREEIRAADTKQAVLGGSRTDINMYEDGAFIDIASDMARRGVLNTALDRTVGALADAIKRRHSGISRKNARKIAEILTDKNKGIYEINRILEIQKAQKTAPTTLPLIKKPTTPPAKKSDIMARVLMED